MARARKIAAIKAAWRRKHCLSWRAARWLIRYGVCDGRRPDRTKWVRFMNDIAHERQARKVAKENGDG